jgi:hypothetical protein
MGDAMNWTNFTFSFGLTGGLTYCRPLGSLKINPEQYLTLGKGTFLVVNTITQYKIWLDQCPCVFSNLPPGNESNGPLSPALNEINTSIVPVWPRPWTYDTTLNANRRTPGYLPRYYAENQKIVHMTYHSGETVLFPSAPVLGISVTGGNTNAALYYINPPGNSYGFIENPAQSEQINPMNFPWDIPCITCQEKWNWGGAEELLYNTEDPPILQNSEVTYLLETGMLAQGTPGPTEAGVDRFPLKPCPNNDPDCLSTYVQGLSLGQNVGNSYYRQFKYRGDRWVHNGYAIKISDEVITGWTFPEPTITISSFGNSGYTGPSIQSGGNIDVTTLAAPGDPNTGVIYFRPGVGPVF